MNRKSLAVEGSPPTGEVRVELARLTGQALIPLALVREDKADSLACVYRGCVRLGAVSVPATIKVQRPVALSGEERSLASAKLDGERALHNQLRQAADGGARLPVVELLPLEDAPGTEAEVLPPSILCARGRHALAPRCPQDGHELQAEELVKDGEEPSLVCPTCGTHYPLVEQTQLRQQVLAASVRHDPACVGCPHQSDTNSDACMRQAMFLNPLPSRVLVFKSWDLDLSDYLRWQQGLEPPVGREWAWARLEEHRRCVRSAAMLSADSFLEVSGSAVRALRDVVTLFGKIVDAVEQLHDRQIAHLNLSPHRIVLSVHAGDLDVSLADLCHAHHAESPLSWRQLRLLPPLDTPFAAPECQAPSEMMQARVARWRGDCCELVVEGAGAPDRLEPRFCVGDWFAVQHDVLRRERFLVKSVEERGGCWHIVGALVNKDEARKGQSDTQAAAVAPAEDGWTEVIHVEVFRHKHCETAADIFSLGMILLYLLAPRSDAPTSYRRALSVTHWPDLLPTMGMQLETCSPRAMVQALLTQAPAALLHDFRDCEAHLAGYEASRPVAQELLGIVLRATVRGGQERFYQANRAGNARRALRYLRADLERVRASLREAPRSLLPAEAFVFGMFRQPFVDAFRKCWSTPDLPAEYLERWKLRHEGLRLRFTQFEDALRRLKENFADIDDLMSEPLRQAAEGLTVTGTPTSLLRACTAMTITIQELEAIKAEVMSQHPEAFQQLATMSKRWERHFGAGPRSGANKGLVEAYRQQWEQKCHAWRTRVGSALERLKQYLEEVRSTLIRPWEGALQQKHWLKRLWRPQRPGEVLLPSEGIANLQSMKAEDALEALRECHLGPGVEVEAALAVLHFEEVRSGMAEPAADEEAERAPEEDGFVRLRLVGAGEGASGGPVVLAERLELSMQDL